MALTYIETVRLLMGDLDEGDNNFFTGEQWIHLFEVWSYGDPGEEELSLIDVANAALATLSVYHAVNGDETKAEWFQKRTDELSRWHDDIKEQYVVDGNVAPTATPDNALTVHNADPDSHPGLTVDVDGPIATHDQAAPSHGAVLAKATATEAGLEGHIAAHPGAVVAGPPADGTVGRLKLTATLLADVDSHADQAALDAVETNLEQALVGLSINGNVLSAPRQGGGTAASAIIPTGTGVADGVIVSADVDVGAETVTVATSTGDTVAWDLTAILDVVRVLITTAQTLAVGANTRLTAHEAAHPTGSGASSGLGTTVTGQGVVNFSPNELVTVTEFDRFGPRDHR